MTLDEMRLLLRLNIDDKHATKYDDEQLRIVINNSYEHLYNKLVSQGKYTARADKSVTIDADAQEEPVAVLMIKPIQVLDANNHPIPIQSQTMSKQSNEPSVYFIQLINARFQSLGYYRVLAADMTFCVTYAARFIPFITDAPGTDAKYWIPEEFHNVIVTHATKRLVGMDDDKASVVRFWVQEFESDFRDMLDGVTQLNLDDQDTADVNAYA